MALSTAGSEPIHRRLDIQGLRAIAVLMVVAFHAGLPLPGGFIGVDVFFVISGFVITAMLNRQWVRDGYIRLGSFYRGRFKRLMPALALMTSVTMVMSFLILSPQGPQQTAARTALGAIFTVANVVIARTTDNYFAAESEQNPLLNTWSLTVEEQFYLIFPALLILAWFLATRSSRLRSAPFVIIGGFAIVSLTLVLLGQRGLLPQFNGTSDLSFIGKFIFGFYSPLTRAWEFAAGALLAIVLTKITISLTPRFMSAVGVLGISMLAASLWLITESTYFPGRSTLLPVMGTLLLLLAGTCENRVSRALSTGPMVRIGDWSYSIYLWHWPFIVFAIYLWPFSPYAAVLAAVISLAPALMSYYWLEQPIRQKTIKTGKGALFLITITLGVPVLLAGSVIATATYYFAPRQESYDVVNVGDLGQTVRFEYMRDEYFPCTLDQLDDEAQFVLGIKRCMQSQEGEDVQVALLGNSHAEHLFVGLADRFTDINISYVYLHGWPARTSENSIETFRQVAEDQSIQVVILATSQWGPDSDEFERSLRELAASGKEVLVTDDIPSFPFDPSECKFNLKVSILFPGNSKCTRDADAFWTKHRSLMERTLKTINSVKGVKLIETARYFCDSKECSMANDGKLFYEDRHHLNIDGSRFLARNLDLDFPDLLKAVTKK